MVATIHERHSRGRGTSPSYAIIDVSVHPWDGAPGPPLLGGVQDPLDGSQELDTPPDPLI